MTLRQAVYDLRDWQYGSNPGHFYSLLYELIAKADLINRLRLSAAYPSEVLAFRMWEAADDPIEFFKKFDIDVSERRKHHHEPRQGKRD